MEGPQQQECEEAMQDELGYINTTIRLVSCTRMIKNSKK